jgi:hypothetical protein
MGDKVSIIINSIFILIATSIIVFSLLSPFNLFLFLIGGFLLSIPILIIRNHLKHAVPFEQRTYEWYKEHYPASIQGDTITCFTCENNSIDVRELQNEIFQKEMYCTECGKTLYYIS